ncbi:MAG: hypothetical protein GY862_06470 [Gammaproteobacteria bacterium]|nr:hypothetical protein [Gammaproteobacteria bacterium]
MSKAKEIKEIKLSNGHSFFVEVEDADQMFDVPKANAEGASQAPIMPDGAEGTSMMSDAADKVKSFFGEKVNAVTGRISAALEYVHQEFDENQPDELTIELSVALKGKSAIPVILSGETSSALKITAKWTKPKHPEST